MGRSSYSFCHDCRTYQENGYGSSGTWMDFAATVEEFDAAAAEQPADVVCISIDPADAPLRKRADLEKNQNYRNFLVRHAGHNIETDRDSGCCTATETWSDSGWFGSSVMYTDLRDVYTEEPHEHHFGCACLTPWGG